MHMEKAVRIPMFPLAILPIPGELLPLHIFEPRYRELLQDLETTDITFGIYFSHEINVEKIGSLMRLESIIKRYPSGESDIIVKCENYFQLDLLLRNFKDKPYPGGDVFMKKTDYRLFPHPELNELFIEYLRLRNIQQQYTSFNLYQIANELSLDVNERYRFLTIEESQREKFLVTRLKFLIHLFQQEERSKNIFHLN
jgi:uncharacterized protein